MQVLKEFVEVKIADHTASSFLWLILLYIVFCALASPKAAKRKLFCAKRRQESRATCAIIAVVMAMTTVVYADILFILNAYITDLLLLLCGRLCREQSARGRRAVASLLGGGAAFLIFVPNLPRSVLVLSRLPVAAVLVFAAWGFVGRGRFLRLYGGFFLVSFVFAGLMGALWHTLHPKRMLYYGAIVYFGIDARALVVLTAVCYALLWVAQKLLERRRDRGTLFDLTVSLGEREIHCRAFLDTGNDLFEPFSGDPVVVLHRSFAEPLGVPQAPDAPQAAAFKWRMIPCRTATGEGALFGFRPDKLTIRGKACGLETDRVYVAVTEHPIKNGEFGALLHPALLQTPAKGRDLHETIA